MLERKPRVLKDLTKEPKRLSPLEGAFREIEETYMRNAIKRRFGETIDDMEARRRYRQWEIRRGI